MEEKLLKDLLEYVVNQESKKIVGKVCKRFEIEIDNAKKKNRKELSFDEVENIKKQIKELLYEFCRDLRDMMNTGKFAIKIVTKK